MRTSINPKSLIAIYKILETKWFFIIAFISTFLFIYYKSIYQPDSYLNDFFSLLILFALFSLTFIYKTKWGDLPRVALVFLLFGAPLYWLWRSGQYDTTAIAGIIPIQDMMQYYSDALLLHYGLPLSVFSSRRPLFAGFLSVILKATNENLQLALIVMAVIVVISVLYLAFEIRKVYGSTTAVLVLILIYYCYKGYGFIGKTMTEQLGLPLGVLALALFLQGLRVNKIPPLLLGLLTLTVALNARAGAFFVVPAIIIWGSFHNPEGKFSIIQAAMFLGSAITGFFLNYLILQGIGNSQGILFENFGHTLYGLTTGYRGWLSLYIDHPGSSGRDAWQYIFDVLRKDPGSMLSGILLAYADYLKPETMFRFLYFPPRSQTAVSYILFGCTVLGVLRLFKMPKAGGFLLWVLLGIFASIPFTPPIDDGIRALTATIPFSVLILGLPFSQTMENLDIKMSGVRSLHAFTLGLLVLSIVGPLLIRFNPEPLPNIDPIVCAKGTSQVALWAKPGSYIRLVDDDFISHSMIPDLRVHDLRVSTAKNPYDFLGKISPIFRRLKAGQSILASINLYEISQESTAIILITPTELVQVNQINRFCAKHIVTDSYGAIRMYLEKSLNPADLLGK